MKCAICFSGLTRSVECCMPSILENFILPLNADVFIHTWDINQVSTDIRFNTFPAFSTVTRDEFFEDFKKKCPSKFILEVEKYSNGWNFKNQTSEGNSVPMFYSIYKANELKQKEEDISGERYDLVVRMRFDCLYENGLSTEEVETVVGDSDVIYVRANRTYKSTYGQQSRNNFILENTTEPYVSDMFAFGNSENMDIYSSTYLHLNVIMENISGAKARKCAETYLGYNLFNNDIDVKIASNKFSFSGYYGESGKVSYSVLGPIDWEGRQLIFESDYEEGRKLHGIVV